MTAPPAWVCLSRGTLVQVRSATRHPLTPWPELFAELCTEINYNARGNLTVDVRARDHPSNLMIATALGLPSRRTVGRHA